MNIFFHLRLFYNYIIYILNLIAKNIKSIFKGGNDESKKIKWNDDDNKVHYTYSKDEYDRTMYKNTNILPFTMSGGFNEV